MALLAPLIGCFFLVPIALMAADYSTKDSKEGCPPSIHHQAQPDVAYKAGENVDGWAVVPADVTPPVLSAEHMGEVEIPVRMPLEHANSTEGYLSHGERSKAASRMSGEAPLPHRAPPLQSAPSSASPHGRGDDSFLQPGRVTVNAATGELRYNGHDISPIDPNELDPDCISAETH